MYDTDVKACAAWEDVVVTTGDGRTWPAQLLGRTLRMRFSAETWRDAQAFYQAMEAAPARTSPVRVCRQDGSVADVWARGYSTTCTNAGGCMFVALEPAAPAEIATHQVPPQ